MYILERSLNLCGQIGFCGKNIYFSRAAPHSPIPFFARRKFAAIELSSALFYFWSFALSFWPAAG